MRKKYTDKRECLNCNKDFIALSHNKEQKFCSLSCSSKYKADEEYREYINKWKEGNVDGGRGAMNGYGAVSHHVRRYLFEKYKEKCAKCGWSERNEFTDSIPLEVEHIDGDSMNHKECNLTLLCPNCHSLTKGHSTSKGKGRRYYRQKYHKEKVS